MRRATTTAAAATAIEAEAVSDFDVDGEAVEEARSFLYSCASHSPQNRFLPLLSRERVESDPVLQAALAQSLVDFEPDLARWSCRFDEPAALFEHLVLSPTLAATYFYRLTRELFKQEVEALPGVLAAVARWMTGCEIYYSAICGPGFKLIHGLGTVIGAHSRIGSHFTAYHGVTLGDRLGGKTGLDQRPVLGDRVIVCTGATIVGPVHIGDDCVVAANSVVLDSVPSRCLVAGSPARVVVENLSDGKLSEYQASFKG